MKNRSWLGTVFFLLFTTVSAHAEWVTLSIVVDEVVIGEVPVDLVKKEAIGINGRDLLKLIEPFIAYEKVQRLNKLLHYDDSLSIEDLSRIGISSTYSEKDLQVVLTIPIEMRVVKDFPLVIKRGAAGLSLYNKNYSGFFNYSLLAGYSSQSQSSSYTSSTEPQEGRFELVQNLNYFTFESTADYREFEQKPFQRAESSLVHDFEESQVRLRLGDFFTRSQAFQSSLPSAGIQLQKQFNIFPERGSLSKRSTTIQVKKNSLMEVYVNGSLITRISVSSGPYNLKELPVLYGQNKITVILLDDFGGKEEFEVDLFFDDQILAKGVHNFTYQIGVPSYYLRNEKLYHPNVYGSFFHQYGVTDQFTVAANYQNYQTSRLMGAGIGILSGIGSNIFDFAYYTDKSVNASNAQSWRYGSPDINTGLISGLRILAGAEIRSEEFKTIIDVEPAASTYSAKYDFILQKQLGVRNSASLGLSKLKGQNGSPDSLSRRLGFQSVFSHNWIFDFSHNWSDRENELDQVLLTLTWLEPAGKALASVSHNTPNNNTAIRLAKNNRLSYNDFQLSALASRQSPQDGTAASQNIDLAGDYFGRILESRLRIFGNSSGSEVRSTTQIGLRSALTWTVDGIALSRHISDSFAIVSPSGLSEDSKLSIPNGSENDNLYLENDQKFVFSNLTAYLNNNLQIDSTDLPPGQFLERESYVIIPKYRTGVFIPLNINKTISVKGKLNSKIAEFYSYAYGKIWTLDGKLHSNNFFTDERGYFVLDGLTPGQYEIELSDPRLKRIPIEIKESESGEIDLGTIEITKEAGT